MELFRVVASFRKFSNSLKLEANDYLIADGEWLSLTEPFTLSLWTKILDDTSGILMRNGQFSLEYNEDATLSGRVYTNNGWAESKTRMPSGQ